MSAPTTKVVPVIVHGDARAVTLSELLDGDQEISILHAGERYLLRLTRQNRLLLTKEQRTSHDGGSDVRE